MDWIALLTRELDVAYQTTTGLMDLTTDDMLDWKPSTGTNWMTTAQLLMHLTNACGACFKGFITGDWGMPADALENLPPEEMLPPAEKMPSIGSVAEAKKLLEEDRQTAADMLATVDDEILGTKKIAAPWDPRESILGVHLLHMIDHLNQHKSQLFYYLKLQGVPVNTGHLWGG